MVRRRTSSVVRVLSMRASGIARIAALRKPLRFECVDRFAGELRCPRELAVGLQAVDGGEQSAPQRVDLRVGVGAGLSELQGEGLTGHAELAGGGVQTDQDELLGQAVDPCRHRGDRSGDT